jgi:hypothetical protein
MWYHHSAVEEKPRSFQEMVLYKFIYSFGKVNPEPYSHNKQNKFQVPHRHNWIKVKNASDSIFP